MKKIEILIKANNIEELLAIPYLKEILKLCQILNTIRSAQRFLIKTQEQSSKEIMDRDNFYSLVTISSLVYEGFKTSDKILKKIAPIIPKEKHNEVTWIHSEVRDKNSFYKSYIEKIRNNIGFHFNYSITNELIKKVAIDFPLKFAQSKSNRKIDFEYILADHLMAELPPFGNIPNHKRKSVLKDVIINLAEYTNKFCDFLDEIIVEALKQYLDLSY